MIERNYSTHTFDPKTINNPGERGPGSNVNKKKVIDVTLIPRNWEALLNAV